MSFQKLLEDLEALSGSANVEGDDVAKSMAADGDGDEGGEGGDADDTKIEAAAADGEDAGEATDAADGAEGAEADEGGDDGEQFGKSLTVIGENGEQEEAIDATDLIKSLVERVESTESNMGKAVGLLTDLVKAQATTIGALQGQVTKLASAGRGRRAVVSVAEKPELTKSLGADGDGAGKPEGITANEFMAKAMEACTAGKITGLEVARAESYLNRGADVPANIKAKVLG
jgi:hypothetical protein